MRLCVLTDRVEETCGVDDCTDAVLVEHVPTKKINMNRTRERKKKKSEQTGDRRRRKKKKGEGEVAAVSPGQRYLYIAVDK